MAQKNHKTFIAQYGEPFQFNWLAPLSLYLIDCSKLMTRLAKSMSKVQIQIAVLYGEKDAYAYTKMFIAQLISSVFLIKTIFLLIALSNGGDVALLFVGGSMVALLPLMMFKDLSRKIERRRRAIILELPLFLNKITLLVNAGETVQKAIIRTVEHRGDGEKHPFYKELSLVLKQLNNNYSFQQSMEELSRRCGVQEVSIFTNTLMLNYRRGGADTVVALRGLAHQLWATRRMMAKTLGEEASSKLVFPLVIIFVVVMLIVGAPAVLMMQG